MKTNTKKSTKKPSKNQLIASRKQLEELVCYLDNIRGEVEGMIKAFEKLGITDP